MIRRILFVTRLLAGGGAERVISVLANELTEQGYEVGIIIFNMAKDEYILDKNVCCFRFEHYDETCGNTISRTMYRWKCLRSIIKSYHPDVVFPFLESAVRETFIASRGLNVKMISTVRNLPQYDSKWKKYFYDFIYTHSNAVFLQTESQKQFFNQQIIYKSFVVPNPVNSVFLHIGKKRKERERLKRIVTAGRLEPQKNHQLLIEAMHYIHKAHPECSLSIYGEGAEYERLVRLIDKLNANDYIALKGRNNHLENVYEQADLFILSSDYEGMPNALIEAMASAMPCVSTDCLTGPKELIGDNQRGRLVPTRQVMKLSKAVIEMIESPKEANELGKRAYNYISEKLSPEKITSLLIENCEKYMRKNYEKNFANYRRSIKQK